MLFWSPPVNLPLITLPFFSSKESAIAADATTHIAKTNPNFCTRFILFVLYVLSVLPSVHNALAYTTSGHCGWLHWQAISTSSLPASRHSWLQYSWPCGTLQRHGMCAHFLFCWSIMATLRFDTV